MHILITNDDGYAAPGIRALARELARVAQISVVAPDRNKSGASNSLTLTRPLRAERSSEGSYYIDGTPTDCVHLALSGLLDDSPDMVVSGINAGPNLGDDVLYSGTVAAAMEGRYKLVIHDNKGFKRELYDLEKDPGEKKDIATKHPELVRKLEAQLRAWQHSTLRSLTGADYR